MLKEIYKDKEFIEAISRLADKEKDKLIIRLLRKDKVLTEKMFFDLVDTQSIEDKRRTLEKHILTECDLFGQRNYSVYGLYHKCRELSGQITHHLKITKDKFGEISLNILVLNEFIKSNNVLILNSRPEYSYKFVMYVINKIYRILILINAIHEDYLLDFKESLEELSQVIGQNDVLMRYAINNELDMNWLAECEIPENVALIVKDLKGNGFLR